MDATPRHRRGLIAAGLAVAATGLLVFLIWGTAGAYDVVAWIAALLAASGFTLVAHAMGEPEPEPLPADGPVGEPVAKVIPLPVSTLMSDGTRTTTVSYLRISEGR